MLYHGYDLDVLESWYKIRSSIKYTTACRKPMPKMPMTLCRMQSGICSSDDSGELPSCTVSAIVELRMFVPDLAQFS
jgi:hypothetical protein